VQRVTKEYVERQIAKIRAIARVQVLETLGQSDRPEAVRDALKVVVGKMNSRADEDRDDDPQSGGSAGKVYDLDAPGITGDVNFVYRLRVNLEEYVVLGSSSNNKRVPNSTLPWWARSSCVIDIFGTLRFNTAVPNDNQAGTGTTNTNWNLQP
jgi:hypothetical protein